MLAVFSRYMPAGPQRQELRYSDFVNDVHNNRVDSVILQGDTIRGVLKDKQQFETYNPETNYTVLIGDLLKANVSIEGQPPKQPNFLAQLLLQLAPALLLMLVFVYLLRQMQGAALIKLLQGVGFEAFIAAARGAYRTVKLLKPKASRSRSPETYLLASGRRMV